MVQTKIEPVHWDVIVERIRAQQCVPFLGAAVNVGRDKDDGLLLGSELALRLMGLLVGANVTRPEDLVEIKYKPIFEPYKDLARLAFQDLPKTALRYSRMLDESGFVNKLKRILPDTDRKPSKLLRTLAELPFELIVTTNYDRLMERALELLSPANLRNADNLLGRIKNESTPLSRYISTNLAPALQDLLDKCDAASPSFCVLPQALLEDLNRLIQDKSLHALEDALDLTPEILGLVEKKPITNSAVKRNRECLENSYPEEIAKPHKLYTSISQSIKTPITKEEVTLNEQEQLRIQKELADFEGLILYKLHGTFYDDDRGPLVITEEDYIEFLTFIGGEGRGIDNQIKEKFVDSSLLFLGYGLEDWNFRAIFKGLIENLPKRLKRMSFAIQKDPSEFWVEFWKAKDVEIYNMDLYDFAGELEHKYKTLPIS